MSQVSHVESAVLVRCGCTGGRRSGQTRTANVNVNVTKVAREKLLSCLCGSVWKRVSVYSGLQESQLGYQVQVQPFRWNVGDRDSKNNYHQFMLLLGQVSCQGYRGGEDRHRGGPVPVRAACWMRDSSGKAAELSYPQALALSCLPQQQTLRPSFVACVEVLPGTAHQER